MPQHGYGPVVSFHIISGWMNTLLYDFIRKWYTRMLNLQIRLVPVKIDDLKEIEKIQKRATKLVIKLRNKSYTDRLIYLNLLTLKYRHLRGDMIEVFTITNNIYDTTVSPELPFNERGNTRGKIILFIMTYGSIFFCTHYKYLEQLA